MASNLRLIQLPRPGAAWAERRRGLTFLLSLFPRLPSHWVPVASRNVCPRVTTAIPIRTEAAIACVA